MLLSRHLLRMSDLYAFDYRVITMHRLTWTACGLWMLLLVCAVMHNNRCSAYDDFKLHYFELNMMETDNLWNASKEGLSVNHFVTINADSRLRNANHHQLYDITINLNNWYAASELIVALISCVGNGAVIAAFCRERRLRKRINYYIVSLAIADFLVGVPGIPCALLESVGQPLNLYGCLLTLTMIMMLGAISTFCLVAVSVDRYWAILHPLAYARNVRKTSTIRIISLCWALGILVGLLPMFGWRRHFTGPLQDCFFWHVMDYDFIVFFYIVIIVLPGLLLLMFYGHIYIVIVRQKRKQIIVNGSAIVGDQLLQTPMLMARNSGVLSDAARQRELKATQNLVGIVMFFMIFWLPLSVITCIKAVDHDFEIPVWQTRVIINLSHLNTAVNPLLYAYHLKDFRESLRSLFGRICCVRHVDVNAKPLPENNVDSRDRQQYTSSQTTSSISSGAINDTDLNLQTCSDVLV